MAQSLENAGSEQPAHDFAEVNGVTLHYAHAGDGPLIVFLHGFPQCWYQFRHQLAEFSRDHLAVAPDRALREDPEQQHASANIVRHIQPLTVTVPTLVMYPAATRWIRPASPAGLERYVPDLTFLEVDAATHWLPEERPELVSAQIREHLARVAVATRP